MKLVDQIASVQHDIWSHWMQYLFKVATPNADGSATIPADKVIRWQKQMQQRYEELSERERESDMEQAQKIMALLSTTTQSDPPVVEE